MTTMDLSQMTEAQFRNAFANMTEAERHASMQIINRRHAVAQDPTPGHLQARLDPLTIQTPALSVIDNAMIGVRDAIACMYERRALLVTLLDEIRLKREPTANDIQTCSVEVPHSGGS